MVNKFYKEKNKKLNIDYINLDKFYKKIDKFTDREIKDFIDENVDKLKQDYIDFSFVNINPKNLIGLEEFNQIFFDKIDDIENQISKNIDFKTIVKELNLSPTTITSYINLDNKKTTKNMIYNSRKDKIEILEDSGNYIFYNIDNLNNKLPDSSDAKFRKQIKKLLFQKEKYEFNRNIMSEINKKTFNQNSFNKLSKNNTKRIKLNSIKDDKTFEINSIEILYSLPVNSFTLIADDQNNVYIAKTISYEEKSLTKSTDDFQKISIEEASQSKNGILKTYDLFLNTRYQVVVNEKTLERVKNYFK